MVSPFCLTIIKTFEKFEPETYLDAAGKPTIGYGHLIKPGETFNQPMSEELALMLLEKDVGEAENAIYAVLPNSDEMFQRHEREALVSWTFNCGAANLASSTMLKRILDGKLPAVPFQMIRWVHAGGKRLPGLVRRRHCEAVWFMGAPDEIVLALARKTWR